MPTTTLSPHARIAALVGVLLIAIVGSAIYVMHGHSQSAPVTKPVVQPQPKAHPTKPVHVVVPAVNPLLPTPLRTELEHSRLVVAGFYNPNSSVDQLTISEARAGAAAAHVPFLPVSLLNDAVAGPLTALLPDNELLPNPGIAIYSRTGTIVYRSDGYLAEAAVAQAIEGSR
jgi:hypothetical protein